MTSLSRRDVLKLSLAGLGGAALTAIAPSVARMARVGSVDRPNVLILLFDTMSALHLSVNGYERQTTPNVERFAQHSTVFHSHYSNGSFTTPGTASLLTGLTPARHRALHAGGLIRRDLASNNIFNVAGHDYYKIGFAQNLWAEVLLRQFQRDLDLHLPTTSFAYPNPMLLGEMDRSDPIAYAAYDDFLIGGIKTDTRYPGSLMLGVLDGVIDRGKNFSPELKNGLQNDVAFNRYYYYRNRDVFQGIHETIRNAVSGQNQPYLGYFHLWSPHEPYRPADEYAKLFYDKVRPPKKPTHPLIVDPIPDVKLYTLLRTYDQYVANVDAEFGMLMDGMERAGLLDNTYVIVLSDHGQLFERGVHGHTSYLLYDGVIRVPLLISAPGQTNRVDIHEPTSNADLLPTLAAITGGKLPALYDGRLLPGLGGESVPEQNIISLLASRNSAFAPLKKGTFVLVKGGHKLMLFTGYAGYEGSAELYDLRADPDELHDLSADDQGATKRMKEELLDNLQDAERELLRSGSS